MRGVMWWVDRWRQSSAYVDMTLAEQGAYRNLLDELWLRGGVLPNVERTLSRACGDAEEWPRVRERVMAQFTLTDEGWRHEVVDEVMAESNRRAAKQKAYRDRLKGKRDQERAGNVTSNVAHSQDQDQDQRLTPPSEVKARKRALVHEPPLADYGLDRVDVAAAWDDFRRVRSEKRLKPWADRTVRSKLKAFAGEPDRLLAALKHSADQEYSGLFEPKNGHAAKQPQRNSAEVLLERIERGEVTL